MRFLHLGFVPSIPDVFGEHPGLADILMNVFNKNMAAIPILTQRELAQVRGVGPVYASIASELMKEYRVRIPQRQQMQSLTQITTQLYGSVDAAPIEVLQVGRRQGMSGWSYLPLTGLKRYRVIAPEASVVDLKRQTRLDLRASISRRDPVNPEVLSQELGEVQDRMEQWGLSLKLQPVRQLVARR